jgi:hypothetical protein
MVDLVCPFWVNTCNCGNLFNTFRQTFRKGLRATQWVVLGWQSGFWTEVQVFALPTHSPPGFGGCGWMEGRARCVSGWVSTAALCESRVEGLGRVWWKCAWVCLCLSMMLWTMNGITLVSSGSSYWASCSVVSSSNTDSDFMVSPFINSKGTRSNFVFVFQGRFLWWNSSRFTDSLALHRKWYLRWLYFRSHALSLLPSVLCSCSRSIRLAHCSGCTRLLTRFLAPVQNISILCGFRGQKFYQFRQKLDIRYRLELVWLLRKSGLTSLWTISVSWSIWGFCGSFV